MENRCGFARQSSGLWRCLRDGDFEEEDVWAVLRDRAEGNSNSIADKSKESFVSVARTFPTAARMVPRTTSSGSSSNSSSHEAKIVQQSAPVNIHNWSQISGKKSKKAFKNPSWLDNDDDDDDDDDDEDEGIVNGGADSDADDNENDGNYMLPPHELVARRLARSKISSFSVFEGVGRTLKGRDLSKVRNAVLTKTGFLESP